jgi:hypothetical protein
MLYPQIKYILCFLLLFVTVQSFSQDGPEPPPEDPALPIADFLPILLLAGVSLGCGTIIFHDKKKISK